MGNLLLKKPILVGGLGLSATFWLLDAVHFNVFDGTTLLSALALGSGVWWWQQRSPKAVEVKQILVETPNRTGVEDAIAAVQTLTATLATEVSQTLKPDAQAEGLAQVEQFRSRAAALSQGLNRQQLAIAVLGDIDTGKTSLVQQLQSTQAALTFQEFDLAKPDALPADLQAQDAILFVTDSDLTESAYQVLQSRVLAGHRVLLVFNKQDQYETVDRGLILHQLKTHVAGLPRTVEVLPIAAAPKPIKVRRHQENGETSEWMESVEPDLTSLQTALTTLIQQETADLVLATTMRQTRALRREVQMALNTLLRQRAMPIVEQSQWIAGAAAFANPVPTLDVLATVAISGQLILDVAKVYGVSLTLEEAKAAAGTLAGLTVKLGLVELSTQALTVVLKTHAATYLAGGLVQGLSAAYLTRMAGLSLIEHFEAAALAERSPSPIAWETVSQRLQTLIQKTQGSFLSTLVQQGIERFRPAPQALTAEEAPAIALPTA